MADSKQTISMDDLMALCKRRGFIYQASEIYGGINGFWDYGPLGTHLKNNLRQAWWQDCVMKGANGQTGPDGNPISIVPIDSCIIQNPKVWEASGHVGGFNDPMIDCKESKSRYRADHVRALAEAGKRDTAPVFAFMPDSDSEKKQRKAASKKFGDGNVEEFDLIELGDDFAHVLGPDAASLGTLTPPRAFNLMFDTIPGAIRDEANKAYLRPETAQGIFINYKNVLDSTRVRVPFGIAQTGKAFRNEVTPRNFTFRSREFEQMEIEFFCHPDDANDWYTFWRDWRMAWWQSLGLAGENLILREHDSDELAHYAKEGAGTSDVEYRFPFTDPGFGELEGIAHRSNYDLRQHMTHAKAKLEYFDQERNERYLPHVIEPSAGLDRGVLAVLCEAFTPDDSRASKVFMKFHPRLAPIKAAVYPLVNKDGMPETALKLHSKLVQRFGHLGMIEYDPKQSIGKRYARMDEAGCPFCFTVD
ncbi:MAG: glycine--tRNA ligase, partial [Planctomycetota bacterium]